MAVISCIGILWPWDWTFAQSPKILTEDWIETHRPEESLPLFLAEKLEDHYDGNASQFKAAPDRVSGCGSCVAVEVILLALQVAS